MSWKELTDAALKVSRETGFPVATIIGQSYAETSGNPAKAPGNNWFGIKGKGQSQKTQEVVNGKRVTINANFAAYKNAEEAVRAYLKVAQSLVPNWKQLANNPKQLVAAIKDAGYATENRNVYLNNATNNPEFRKYASITPTPTPTLTEEQFYNKARGLGSEAPANKIINEYRNTYKNQSSLQSYNSFNPFEKVMSAFTPQAYAEGSSQGYSQAPQGTYMNQPTPLNNYVVQPGDTMWGIAQKYLGAGSRWKELQGYGGTPTQMPVGTHITLPQQKPAPNTSTPNGPVYTPAPQPNYTPLAAAPKTAAYQPTFTQTNYAPAKQLNLPTKTTQPIKLNTQGLNNLSGTAYLN